MEQRVTIGSKGTITFPKRIRQEYGLRAKDELIIQESEEGILLRPAVKPLIEEYSEGRIAEFASDEDAVGDLLRT
jgi:AbrB family looped-hinge helix DNA binding protein